VFELLLMLAAAALVLAEQVPEWKRQLAWSWVRRQADEVRRWRQWPKLRRTATRA